MLARAIPDIIQVREGKTQNTQTQPRLPRVQRPAIFYNVEQGCSIIGKLRIFDRKFLKIIKLQDVILLSFVLLGKRGARGSF